MKGLICSVFESKAHGNCSANGISSRCKQVTLCPDYDAKYGMGIPSIFEVSAVAPAVVVRSIRISEDREHFFAVPVELTDTGAAMFGGSFIYTSDSRFPMEYPLPLHDRVEDGRGYAE